MTEAGYLEGQSMRVWLIKAGEPLPIGDPNARLLRMGIIANYLVQKGHEVVWWTSTFDHARKKLIFKSDTTVKMDDRYYIKLLHSISYKKNVSLSRLINHFTTAKKFARFARFEVRPDVILCALPTPEFSFEAVKYGVEKGIPVVIDIRDLWPDIFLEVVPLWGRKFFKILLMPFFCKTRKALKRATAISGVTPAFIDWGLSCGERIRSDFDREFPLACNLERVGKEQTERALKFWQQQGIYQNNQEFIICFFGAMGRQFDLETVIEAAKKLKDMKQPFKFILCGSGDKFSFYKSLALGYDNIIFPGWVGKAEIWTLMRVSSVGLAPYISNHNFIINITNKVIEYMSAGLPIVSSLKGVLEKLLSENVCGVTYENNNPDNLVLVLNHLFENREHLTTMSENAQKLFMERFNGEKVYNEMVSYLELIAATFNRKEP